MTVDGSDRDANDKPPLTAESDHEKKAGNGLLCVNHRIAGMFVTDRKTQTLGIRIFVYSFLQKKYLSIYV